MSEIPPNFSALMNLLQDENPKVVSLVMEHLLKLGPATERLIAEYQESSDPALRARVHQLGIILARRRVRREFIASVRDERVSLWEGLVRINALYDLQCDPSAIEERVWDLVSKIGRETPTAARVAAFMRDQEFAVPSEDTLDVDLYLLERVLDTCFGSPAVLCALAREIGRRIGWFSTIVLSEGQFCLVDRNNLLVDPTEEWHVRHLREDENFHSCARKHVWLGVLSQMFLVSLVEGNLRDLHHFGDLLTALNGVGFEILPYPLGEDAAGR